MSAAPLVYLRDDGVRIELVVTETDGQYRLYELTPYQALLLGNDAIQMATKRVHRDKAIGH